MMWLSIVLSCFFAVSNGDEYLTRGFRPPAVPLIVTNPYNSFWSVNDSLHGGNPQFWTGSNLGSVGMIRIYNDTSDNTYRFLGAGEEGATFNILHQLDVFVYPTQTVYIFQQDGIQLNVTFSSPALMNDERFIGLPVTYVTFEIKSIDGNDHKVDLYYDNTGEGIVSDVTEEVAWQKSSNIVTENITLKEEYIGFRNQSFDTYDIAGKDRINWGRWYLATEIDTRLGVDTSDVTVEGGSVYNMRNQFINGPDSHVSRPTLDSGVSPCVNGNNTPVLSVSWTEITVKANDLPSIRKLRIFVDSNYSIDYFGTDMIPLWKHIYSSHEKLLGAMSYEDVINNCSTMDTKIMKALYAAGGSKYATIGALAWRQAIGGLTAVWNNYTNTSWIFLKEISSDGDVSTVDVLFPASPLYLWASPEALKKMLIPIMEYANNNTAMYGKDIPYNLSWAPHHLGKWPVCNLEPNDQEQMPVEESGNMLMMIAGIVKYQRNDTNTSSPFLEWLKPYWGVLRTWADYIVASLPNPGNQLCTDDFEGPSPNNTNLAVKGIVGLSSYIYLLEAQEEVEKKKNHDILMYRYLNKQFVLYFHSKGLASTKDHYLRQFGLEGSWSLKYNLLFQKILGTSDFNDDFIKTELDFYKTKMHKYGIALDERHTYAKTDWLMWIAALADEDMFRNITASVYAFANDTPQRSPFTDRYDVTNAYKVKDFRARPVIGGLFARLLTNPPEEE